MDKEKVIINYNNGFDTGYYSDKNNFVCHSFNDEPSRIWYDGTKLWYENGGPYWFIENKKFNSFKEVYKKYKDKMIITTYDIIPFMNDKGIDFIFLDTDDICRDYYLILDDTDRNEVILRYG